MLLKDIATYLEQVKVLKSLLIQSITQKEQCWVLNTKAGGPIVIS